MLRWRFALTLLTLTVHYVQQAQSVSFEVEESDTKCIAEDVHVDVLVLGEYHVYGTKNLERTTHKVHARVTSPNGATVHLAENVTVGEFGFKATETGSYVACFWMENQEKGAAVVVDIDWKTGVAAKDWASIAKKDKIEGLELDLRKLEDLVLSIHEEMLYLREKEQEMRDFNQVTNNRLAIFTVSSLLLCLLVAGWQSLHLKSFFERKKLL